jgi:aryl-alcohol dehydrogenase-like predicted oxidoreductase
MSAIGFGAWELSIDTEEVRAMEAIHAGVAAGMTWVNTAEMYGMGTACTAR